jgi:hypothetical protein
MVPVGSARLGRRYLAAVGLRPSPLRCSIWGRAANLPSNAFP